MERIKLTEQQIDKVRYLSEKMKEPKHLQLYLQMAKQIGIDQLEKAIGLTLEDSNIRNKGAYLTAICKSYGFKPNNRF